MNEVQATKPLRLYVFGDSIAAGMGLHGDEPSYGSIVARQMNLLLVDMSNSAQMVDESRIRAQTIPSAPAVAIVSHGVTEAIPRPTPRALRLVPTRWRRTGWLDPRPYHSPRHLRGLLTRLESATRWRVKVLLMRLVGSECMMDRERYGTEIDALIDLLETRRCRVIVVGPPDISERYFPGAGESHRSFQTAPRRTPDVRLSGTLHRWDDYLADDFHPNAGGHRKIAQEILDVLGRDSEPLRSAESEPRH